jgi:signal transduction histidine kinase
VGRHQSEIRRAYLSTNPASATMLFEHEFDAGQMAAIAANSRTQPGIIDAAARTQLTLPVQQDGGGWGPDPLKIFVAAPDDPMRIETFTVEQGHWPPGAGEILIDHDRPPSVHVVATTPEILVDVDADRMRTVIRNLLENAIKYSLPDSRGVEVSAAQNGERVVIRVTDDGPGIPERDMPSLFEPFFRVDRSRSKKTGGYGLGLSISKRIVEAHGGTIGVEKNARRGASFIVTLPKSG